MVQYPGYIIPKSLIDELKKEIMAQYPGYIMRQSLIDELEKRIELLKDESDKIHKALEKKGLDKETKTALGEFGLMTMGQIVALRDINEWAKQHAVPPAVQQ